ncbi:hypothetical protein Tco_0319906 [Tanacetum coccineum]
MAAPVIPISSDSSEESVGSHVPRVILFGTIPTSIPVIPVVPAEVPIAPADPLVAPEVGAVSVISPTRVLDLVDYSSSSDSDPSEDSLPVAPELPLVSPFLCSDDSEADSESEPAEQRPERHESLTPSSEFPLAPVVAPPGIRRRPAILVRPGEAIPFGRPYRTHPNGPRKLLTARKRVGLPVDLHGDVYLIVLRIVTLYQILLQTHLLLVHLRILHQIFLQVHLQIHYHTHHQFILQDAMHQVRTPRCSEAFMRWRSAPLSTLYPPTTSESSLDSSSKSLALADLSPRKRFRDSYSFEVSGEEHMEIGTAEVENVADLGISEGVGSHTKDDIDLGVEVATSDIREDEEEFEVEANAGGTIEVDVDPLVTGGISEPAGGDAPDLEGTLYDISHYMSEVPLDNIIEFETTQRQLKAGQLVASGERAGLADRVRSLGRENLRVRSLLCIKRDHVDSLRRHMALSQEKFHQVRRDRDDTRRRLRRLESLVERRLGFRRSRNTSLHIITHEIGTRNEEILDAQVKARNEENYGTEDLCGMIKKLEPRADGTLKGWDRHPTYSVEFSYNNIYQTIIKASPFGSSLLLIIQAARDRKKSYADRRRKPLEFEVGDKVMLKVLSWKGVIRFGKRELNPRYIGLLDEPLAIPLDEIQIEDKLHFIKEPVEIMDREVKQLKQSRIPIMKVRRNLRRDPSLTMGARGPKKKQYPHLFVNILQPRLKL